MRKEATFTHSTSQLQEESITADSKKEGDNNSLPKSVVDNNHPLLYQPMPPLTVPSEILSPLTNIFRANTPLLPKTFQDSDIDLPESLTTDQSKSSRQFSLKFEVIKCTNYKNLKRPSEAMSILQSQNVFHAKHIPQTHTHMVQVLSALANRNNLGFPYYSELQNY